MIKLRERAAYTKIKRRRPCAPEKISRLQPVVESVASVAQIAISAVGRGCCGRRSGFENRGSDSNERFQLPGSAQTSGHVSDRLLAFERPSQSTALPSLYREPGVQGLPCLSQDHRYQARRDLPGDQIHHL